MHYLRECGDVVRKKVLVMKRILVSLVFILLLLGMVAGGVVVMRNRKPQPRRAPSGVHAIRVVARPLTPRRNFQVEIIGYGAAQPRTRLEIAPRVAGEIIATSDAFRSGRMVQGPTKTKPQGEMLFRIDPEPHRLAVKNAKQGVLLLEAQLASLDQEKANLEATRKLQEKMAQLDKQQLERVQSIRARGVGTDNEVDIAQAKYLTTRNGLQATQNQWKMIPQRRGVLEAELGAAKVKLEQAQLDLDDTTYRAPVTGRVIRAEAELGEHVQVGQVCGELYGTDRMEIPVSISTSDVRWLDPVALKASIEQNPGAQKHAVIRAKASWSIPGGRVLEWNGTVGRIEAGLQAQTRTARLIVCIDNTQQANLNRDDFFQLDLNMYCKVTILGRVAPEAFLLPRNAIQPDGTVYLAEPDTKNPDGTERFRLTRREVKIVRYTDDQAMILPGGGLQAGDRVITTPLAKPVIGMTINVMTPKPTTKPTTAPTTKPTPDS